MKGALLLVVVAIVAVLLALVVRAVRVPMPPPPADATATVVVDTAASAGRLAGAIRFRTVSMASGAPIDTAAFQGLHEYLRTSFPLLHAKLTRETISGASLLYTWSGSDDSAEPVVLMGHLDVVPVPEANLSQWEHAPFSGDIADGFVWGRGTLDDKATVLAVLEAVEQLLAAGFTPPRTVYLSFGHDEEVGGLFGARRIVERLVARGVHPSLVLDEGGTIGDGLVPGMTGRAAIIGIAEKGSLSLRIRALAPGGHSSMPAERTAVGALSRAIAALEREPFPAELDGSTRQMLEALAPYTNFGFKLALANLWLTGPFVRNMLIGDPLSAALIRTTTAPTMLEAGIKDNVLPTEASAVVNFRIRPGETTETVIGRVRSVIADSLILIEQMDSTAQDPSPVSDTRSPAWKLVAETARRLAPGESVPVLPYLVVGSTDARYWGAHSDRVFRFIPISLGPGDVERVHGLNERVAVRDYVSAVAFFVLLLQGLDRL